ncbi:hypothetical protein RHSIM_Rhsim06G0166900 [Rhododendron simsii]|uniref:EamA domain-containing protein n=1 Tax=Rhododendron simsii TaxID=118357 RepID=A0A834GSK2_RHOSS|nr:hypothetical protein RHSIM_Rhsim06G0166900 [Rhododendron simsii]
MSSSEPISGDDGGEDRELADVHVVELVAASMDESSPDSILQEQIAPLLAPLEKPKINIFAISYPRRKPYRDQVIRLPESEISLFTQFFTWAWSGSRYSGLLCMALSSTIYCIMEVLSDIFSVQAIPLFEITTTRCTIIAILSFMWLRRSGQPIFGQTNRNLLVSRALVGYLSLLSFVYWVWKATFATTSTESLGPSSSPNWDEGVNIEVTIRLPCIQRLPLSQAIILSFTTPIMASLAARVILREKLKIAEIGGLACSFFGVLFIFRPMTTTQGWLAKAAELTDLSTQGSHHIYAVLIGLFSSITGGISYCLIRAGAKASDQPVVTVFSFGILASPASVICTFAFEDIVLPNVYSFVLMVVLGIMAFFAELYLGLRALTALQVLLARGLQLEKTSKVANIQYVEAALSQLWGMGLQRIAPSFGRVVGCSLILISAFCTMYIGPDKDTE